MSLRTVATLAIGAYLFYVLTKGKDKTTDTLANLWLKLFPLPPAMELLGNVRFPGNILIPLNRLAQEGVVKQTGDHSVVVMYQGHIWKLAPSDADGNWPATRMS